MKRPIIRFIGSGTAGPSTYTATGNVQPAQALVSSTATLITLTTYIATGSVQSAQAVAVGLSSLVTATTYIATGAVQSIQATVVGTANRISTTSSAVISYYRKFIGGM